MKTITTKNFQAIWPVINPFFVEDLIGNKKTASSVIKSVRDQIKNSRIINNYILIKTGNNSLLFDVVKNADGQFALMCSGVVK